MKISYLPGREPKWSDRTQHWSPIEDCTHKEWAKIVPLEKPHFRVCLGCWLRSV